MQRRVALISALVAMAVGVASLVLYTERFEREATGGEKVLVVVAAQDIPLGTNLTREMLGTREVPERYVETRHIPLADVDRVVGLRVTSAVRADESLLWTDLASAEQRRDLSGLVQDGLRAFTIRSDSTSSFGGLLRPGDRVDVLLTAERGRERETAPIAQNLLVLATGGDTGWRNPATGSRTPSFSEVTLSVTLEQAETLALAQRQGDVSLALRHPDDIRIQQRAPVKTSSTLIAPAEGAP